MVGEAGAPTVNDGYCIDCGEEFHLDDTGGYNPPCPCGCGLCRSCCAGAQAEEDEWESELD